MNTPSVLIDCQDHNAENPLWHPQHNCLYWSDVPEGRLFRYDPRDKEYEQIYSGEPVGGFTIQADGALLLLKAEGTVEIWKEGDIIPVIPSIPEAKGSRFNDAIADRKGRVYAGIIATEEVPGRLYRIDLDGSYHAVVEDLFVPNGMGFDLDYTHFYLTDSEKRTIYRFDYHEETGELSNQTIHITTPEGEGIPDGMTIDAEGYLWSARWNGSAVHRYDPNGEHHSKLTLPVKKISCVTFGGDSYEHLFISTAKGDNPPSSNDDKSNKAGDIFYLKPAVKGRPERLSCIQLTAYSYDTMENPIMP